MDYGGFHEDITSPQHGHNNLQHVPVMAMGLVRWGNTNTDSLALAMGCGNVPKWRCKFEWNGEHEAVKIMHSARFFLVKCGLLSQKLPKCQPHNLL